jgi:hypothetical protein
MARVVVLNRIGLIPLMRSIPLMSSAQQPVEDTDVPVVGDEPSSMHGAVLVPVGTTDGWLWRMSGNGLMPPVASSVDPIGIPARPTVDREPIPGDEADAVGLEDAVAVPVAHVPEAVPDTPVLSNKGVGADIPIVMVLLLVIEFPALETPESEVDCCADAPTPEHVKAAVMPPRGDVPAALGLTPGVVSSVAPSGIPVVPTGAPGPIPSGDVTPSEAGAPVIAPTWANAGPQHNKTAARMKNASVECSPIWGERSLCETIGEAPWTLDRSDPMHETPMDVLGISTNSISA